MKKLRVVVHRVAGIFGKRRRDRELADEIESNLQLHIADYLRAGITAEEARRQAVMRIGGIEQTKEAYRDQRGLPVWERVGKDFHYAARMFRKSRGFTLFAGAALALGIASTTAIFSIVDAVLLRPFPYRNPSRLVAVWEDDTVYGFPRNNGSPFAFLQWRQRNHVFEDMAALTHNSLNLTGHGTPEYLHADAVTPNFFSLLGVGAFAGRTFTAADGTTGAPLTAVLSYGLWRRQFGADPRIVGSELSLSGAKYTVIGVMPRRFVFLDPEIELWVPAQWSSEFIEQRKTDRMLTIVARLKPGVSVARANAEMADLGRQLAAEQIWNGNAVAVPLREQVSGDVTPALLLLLGAVGFLLLIACANVANLLLARAGARTREMAMRVALGASRRRVMEQVMVESVLLSCVAGAAGVGLAVWATQFITTLIPPGIADGVHVDGTVLGFAAAASVATGILFGILPAWRASQIDLVDSLKQGSAQSGIGSGGQRLRNILVVAEVSLAVVLLAGAALMIRSFEKLYHQDPGFRAQHVLTLQTTLPRPKYDDFARRSEFYREVVQRVESLPGVVAAGYATYLPLAFSGGGSLVTVENKPFDPKHMLIANVRVVTPDYFRAVGMSLLQGRLLSASDGPDAPKAVVVNQALARTYWPGQDPIGRRFKRGLPDSKSNWWTVVGVVADMRQGGMEAPVRPEAYFSTEQADFFAPDSLAIRTVGDPASVAAEVRKQIWAVDPDQPIANVTPMAELVDASVAPARTNTLLLAGFGFMGLLLAALGMYGVLSLAVTQGTRDIGVRLALGARPTDIQREVIGSGMRLFGIGLAIGFAAAVALSQTMSHLLFEITPGDPISYAAMVAILGAVTILACYVPARRATKVDPMVALRYE